MLKNAIKAQTQKPVGAGRYARDKSLAHYKSHWLLSGATPRCFIHLHAYACNRGRGWVQ